MFQSPATIHGRRVTGGGVAAFSRSVHRARRVHHVSPFDSHLSQSSVPCLRRAVDKSCLPIQHETIQRRSLTVLKAAGSTIQNDERHPWRFQQVRTKVFVSRHNTTLNVTADQILQQCSSHGISETRTSHSHVILKECPFCSKPTNNKADNFYKLYVSIGGGAYFCHRCGSKGSWYDFKMKLGGYDLVSATEIHQSSHKASLMPSSKKRMRTMKRNSTDTFHTIECLPMPEKRLQAAYITRLMDQKNPASGLGLEYLTEVRGINTQTLRKYGVGQGVYNFPSNEPHSSGQRVEAECITFPWIMRASDIAEQESLRGATYTWEGEEEQPAKQKGKPVVGDNDDDITERGPFVTRRIKARALSNKGWQRLDPPGGGWGLFGYHTVPSDATEIVITEGEYDAMAVFQATRKPAVSLPNGCRSLPVEVLPLLEKFERIYLWMDNDAPGQEGAEKFAKKLGLDRCLIVKPTPTAGDPPKDANMALLQGCDLGKMLEDASVLPHERIMQFSELRTQVLHEITHPEKYVGVSVPSLPAFTDIVKGFRRGELTVLTGPTGSGKTTFLGQLSLDFAEQGVNTLWGSFEIKNTRLMHKLLQQFSREPLPVGKPEMANALDVLADRFEDLPLYFMKFHGGSDVDDVLDAMDYATYVHDVEHIILDNLQFMISRNTLSGSFDKFDMQDIAIEKFRKFATDRNVHVTLVVHPRKEDEGAKLGISSIYGSAKATQEADTVLILQSDGRRKFIEVKKNRFDGALGFSPLHFQRASGRYLETPELGMNNASNQVKSKVTFTPAKAQTRASSSAPQQSTKASLSDGGEDIENHWDDLFDETPKDP